MAGLLSRITSHVVEGVRQGADDFKAAIKSEKVALVSGPHSAPDYTNGSLMIKHMGASSVQSDSAAIRVFPFAQRGQIRYYKPDGLTLRENFDASQVYHSEFGQRGYTRLKSVELDEFPNRSIYAVRNNDYGKVFVSHRSAHDFSAEYQSAARAEFAALAELSIGKLKQEEGRQHLRSALTMEVDPPKKDTSSTSGSSTAVSDTASVHSSSTAGSTNSSSTSSSTAELFKSGVLMEF